MSASTVPARGPLSFRRIVDVPFETCAAAFDPVERAGPDGGLRFGGSLLRGPAEHDHDSGTYRIWVRLARGPLRPPLRMRLDIDRWSATSTAVELIPGRRVRPTAAYFRAGHLLLDSLTRALPQHLPPAHTPDTASPRTQIRRPTMRTSAKPESAANGTPTQHHELISSATEAPLHGPVRSSRQSQRNR